MTERGAEGDAGREPGTSTASGDAASSAERFGHDLHVWLKWVMADHELPALAFVVAYAIGQHMDRGTRTAFPGLLCLAGEVGRDEKNVRKAVRALVSRGHLIVAKRRGGGGSTHYTMPAVKRAKSPAPPDGDDTAERAKSPGQRTSRKGSERAKSPGQSDGPNGSERAFSSVQSGRNRPPNHLSEPSDCSAAAPPRPSGGKPAGFAREVGPQPFLDPAEVAQADRRKALDAAWSSMVGPDLARTLGKTDALHQAIAGGEVTAEDVEAGIRDGMAKGDSAPASWRWFGGWARQAAKRRAAGGRPDRPRDELAAFAPPPAGMIELPGGWRHTEAALAAELMKFTQGIAWNETIYGFPPDSPYNQIPVDFLARYLDMVKLKDGRSVPACAAKRAAEDFHAYHGREWNDIYGTEPGTPGCLLSDDLQAYALRPRKAIPRLEDTVRADVVHAKFG